jgi:hypothetical protein
MEKQTAVEWLSERLIRMIPTISPIYKYDIKEYVEQAKEMEKEQIEEAFSIGEMNNDSHHYTGRKIHQDQTDYFKKTYAK